MEIPKSWQEIEELPFFQDRHKANKDRKSLENRLFTRSHLNDLIPMVAKFYNIYMPSFKKQNSLLC